MRIEIEKQIDAETIESWYFNTFDFNIVFVEWVKKVKPKGKRKWIVEKHWDNYNKRSSSASEPVLTDIIRNEALTEAYKLIKVQTWNEWKSK